MNINSIETDKGMRHHYETDNRHKIRNPAIRNKISKRGKEMNINSIETDKDIRHRYKIDDMHKIRNPASGSLGDVYIWKDTLCKKRIPPLFRTRKNLSGHVKQLQNELNRSDKVEGLSGEVVTELINSQREIRDAVTRAFEDAKNKGFKSDGSYFLSFNLIRDQLNF